MFRFLLVFLIPLSAFAQSSSEYQGLLWKITGNGLDKPSYLYGTMHVSNRVAFHLSETFFKAIDKADIIALESNPETMVESLVNSDLYRDFFEVSYRYASAQYPLYSSFVLEEPKQNELEYYLARDQDILNNLLFRNTQYDQDFEENTYLDLFIYQAGKKSGKRIVPLENFQESFKQVLLASQQDEDAVRITERQARELLGNFDSWQALMEDAYRRGDLDLMDTINSSLNPGKYYRKHMLDVRNKVMVHGMDSLMQEGSVFTGVGAAHLPGNHGVINLLREMGYTVKPEDRSITSNSIAKKEAIDEVIYEHELEPFESDDGFITAVVPGKMVKFLSHPYQEYVFADMANGGFYSIRRIATFGQPYGHGAEYYRSKIDSMLFENIPGKILSKDTIETSGYTTYDIRNVTRTGDHQHYKIVFTPLELIIFKVGGNKEFTLSGQPDDYMESIELHPNESSGTYEPRFAGFKVNLPGNMQIEKYEAAFMNPHYTFWVQSIDTSGNYYKAGLRQYHDFDYLEEDAFELTYMVRQMVEEKSLTLDTVYLTKEGSDSYSTFELSNTQGVVQYGQLRINGPRYVMLLTNNTDQEERSNFFNSFAFTPWQYSTEFKEYMDTSLHVTLTTPKNINNYVSFINSLSESPSYYYYDDEDDSFEGETQEKIITYDPTGEQIKITLETMHKYKSFSTLEKFWNTWKEDLLYEYSMQTIRDTLLYTKEEGDDYLSQAREFILGDTNTHRAIRIKAILENGAVYSLFANIDTLNYTSRFVTEAFASFRPSEDTIIGLPITQTKTKQFYDALESMDSTLVHEAKNSIYTVAFSNEDSKKIIDLIRNYDHPDFERENRLELLNKLAWLGDNGNIQFLEDIYYQNMFSSSYQFKVLETLADYRTEEGNRRFLKLILEEPPFSSDSWAYQGLMNEFNDSLELAPSLFPDLLTLTEFEEYRSSIYGLLTDLVDSNLVSQSHYQDKFKSILLFARVELKKQRASDEDDDNDDDSYNHDLQMYTKLLIPFAENEDVQEHFRNLQEIENKKILADMLVITDPYTVISGEKWNSVAEDPEALYTIYPYLRDKNKLDVLDEQYRSEQALAKAILIHGVYASYDTIAFITSKPVDIKPYAAKTYFFKGKDEEDKLWKLLYVVIEDKEVIDTDYAMAESGERFHEQFADIDIILEDALKDIELYERERAASSGFFDPGFW